MGKYRDLTGQKFHRLTVLKQYSNNHGQIRWLCKCECGNTTIVLGGHLTSGHTKSCGCLDREKKATQQGLRVKYPRLYHIWSGMKSRCENPKNKNYIRYGARGITICPEWHDLNIFIQWALNNGYDDNLSIDRIDVDKGYSPNNCRWADIKTQANNKRNVNKYSYNGEEHTIPEWADMYGIRYKTLWKRLKRGMSIEDALLASN